jgi:hypothetical protein
MHAPRAQFAIVETTKDVHGWLEAIEGVRPPWSRRILFVLLLGAAARLRGRRDQRALLRLADQPESHEVVRCVRQAGNVFALVLPRLTRTTSPFARTQLIKRTTVGRIDQFARRRLGTDVVDVECPVLVEITCVAATSRLEAP